jgi:hypothetical protein
VTLVLWRKASQGRRESMSFDEDEPRLRRVANEATRLVELARVKLLLETTRRRKGDSS